jgi:hypothetical protein
MKHVTGFACIVAVLAASAFLSGCGGGGQVATGSIEGYVYVPEQSTRGTGIVLTRDALVGYTPVPLATVEATVGTTTKTAKTDLSGHFKIEGLPVGRPTDRQNQPPAWSLCRLLLDHHLCPCAGQHHGADRKRREC